MSWKSFLSAGLAVCFLSSAASAAPSISVTTLPYSAADGAVRYIVRVTQNTAAYDDALSVELPLDLNDIPHTARVYTEFMNNAGTDDTNGANNRTWYYNQTGPGAGDPLLWNITDPALATDHTQNNGFNPFTSTIEDGLEFESGDRVFAALGSTVNRTGLQHDADAGLAGTQVNTLHISASDGILSWSGAIVGENGSEFGGISGSFNSIRLADMNGDKVVNGLDVTPFVQVLTNLTGAGGYQANFPGLDGVARGNINGDNDANGLDVSPFVTCVTSGGCPPGGGSGTVVLGGGDVPEPASLVLLIMAAMGLSAGRRIRK